MVFKVLLVEDAEESRDLVCRALGPSFDVRWVPRLDEARQLIRKDDPHLILLDVGLPDGDGFHFFSMLKNEDRFKSIPVIFLTCHDSDADKVMGISMGAEDYIVKPFSGAELKARVEMRIKKNTEKLEVGQIVRKGELEANLAEQRVFLKTPTGREDLQLTPLEFKILLFLLKNEEQVFSREQVLNQVWGENTYLTDRCIDTHVYSLRKKLRHLSQWIKSVYGQGYRFSTRSTARSSSSKKAA